ncbi:hypothetical protein M0R45_025937 [Rubus argutus]|uniref:Secreted protein n=1 Tax=Rubus argutus TaxID=59490 RepID=A0AAW1WZF2_RUBAR
MVLAVVLAWVAAAAAGGSGSEVIDSGLGLMKWCTRWQSERWWQEIGLSGLVVMMSAAGQRWRGRDRQISGHGGGSEEKAEERGSYGGAVVVDRALPWAAQVMTGEVAGRCR